MNSDALKAAFKQAAEIANTVPEALQETIAAADGEPSYYPAFR